MKKGHIFTLDVLIAFVILIIGVAIIYYAYPVKNKVYYNTERISEDIIAVLLETNIQDLCVKPGVEISNGCNCPNYKKIEELVCNIQLRDKEGNLLSLFTEVIETGALNNLGLKIEEVIKQIFVEKYVIDEKRFGFALIYTTPHRTANEPLQLYNTENLLPKNAVN